MGSTVCKAMKVHYVNVDNGELDHLGDLSDVTSGLLGFSGPLLAISDLTWDKKDQDGEKNAKWNLRAVLSSDEVGNFTAYNEYAINDGILQTPDWKSWGAAGGMKDIIAKAFANAKEASKEEFSSIGYDVIAMNKIHYDLVGQGRDTEPTGGGKNRMIRDKVLCLLDSDESVKQSVVDAFSARVLTSRSQNIPMTELMWEVQPWMLKSTSYLLADIKPEGYPMPEKPASIAPSV